LAGVGARRNWSGWCLFCLARGATWDFTM